MFFFRCADASIFARLEIVRTHRRHVVKPTVRYRSDGSFVRGYTVILWCLVDELMS